MKQKGRLIACSRVVVVVMSVCVCIFANAALIVAVFNKTGEKQYRIYHTSRHAYIPCVCVSVWPAKKSSLNAGLPSCLAFVCGLQKSIGFSQSTVCWYFLLVLLLFIPKCCRCFVAIESVPGLNTIHCENAPSLCLNS